MNKTNNEIYRIDQRLTELRKDWVKGSPAMKKWIEVGAKALKDKRDHLMQKNAENANNDLI